MTDMTDSFKMYDMGVSEVAECWNKGDWIKYNEWKHVHEYVTQDNGSCPCVICGKDGNV